MVDLDRLRKNPTFYVEKNPKKRKQKRKNFSEKLWKNIFSGRRYYKYWDRHQIRKELQKRKKQQRYPVYVSQTRRVRLLKLYEPLFKKNHKFNYLWRLNSPRNTERYRLKTEAARLASHSRAFQHYYDIAEKPCTKTILSLKNKYNRVGKLMRRFETRLDVALCRIGWCYNLEQARSWITEGRIFINENVKKKAAYVLQTNDKLRISGACKQSHKIAIFAVERNLHRKESFVKWRMRIRTMRFWDKPLNWDRARFQKYRKAKRYRRWCKFFTYFFYQPKNFTINYNSLTAVYKPCPKYLPLRTRYPLLFGGHSNFEGATLGNNYSKRGETKIRKLPRVRLRYFYFWNEMFPSVLNKG